MKFIISENTIFSKLYFHCRQLLEHVSHISVKKNTALLMNIGEKFPKMLN